MQKSPATQIKIRTSDPNRILGSVTHPTEDGASRLTFHSGLQTAKELLLLLGILHEEFRAQVSLPNHGLDMWLDEEPTQIRSRVPSLIEDSELQHIVEVPPPSPEILCEFNLLVGQFKRRSGPITAVVFDQLTFTFPKPKVRYVRSSEETGDGIETTGVWRILPQREGSRVQDCEDKKRQTG